MNNVKKSMRLSYRTRDGIGHEGEVIQRTGKDTGKYKRCWEVKDYANDETEEYDIWKDWLEWTEW